MSKNECNNSRDIDNPYEVWRGPANFEWRVVGVHTGTVRLDACDNLGDEPETLHAGEGGASAR